MRINEETRKVILKAQKLEITEYYIYTKLATSLKNKENAKVLEDIAADEFAHYNTWKNYTKEEVKPSKLLIFLYYWIARIFGITFGLKFMERGESRAQIEYDRLFKEIPEIEQIINDEDKHEHELINLINEERLKYVGSVVLGLNDALVELTGTLAGLTFALKDTTLIALAGLITGIAATLSMAASEYLATKSEDGEDALKSSLYTGIAYLLTVVVLITPYLILDNYLGALALTIINAILVILVFNFYISIAKDLNFKKRFIEMASISLGVAILSFGIGVLVRIFLGVDV